jgi:uncharacterized protein YdeI (YjbR/CyaY-like superfamily)
MTAELATPEVRKREQWRTWPGKHHASSPGIWLVCYKDHTGVKSIPYEDTVRGALCFGWIDSLVKRLDDDRYARKLTPRRPTSKPPGLAIWYWRGTADFTARFDATSVGGSFQIPLRPDACL